MAKILFILVTSILLLSIFSCDLDDFLFDNKSVDRYELPGNTIPDSLLELVSFNSEGNILYGYWIESNGEHPGITLLYCHGNFENLDYYWDRVMILHRLGVNVLVFDYRGFGMSKGEPAEEGMYADGDAAIGYLLDRGDVQQDSLCIYGYSLGNVTSIYIAADRINPLCLFAEAPFASANSLAQGSLLLDFPSRWLTDGEFDNVDKIKRIETPFMLLHGEKDAKVRYRDNGKIIYDNAPQPKSLILLPNAEHNNIPFVMGEEQYLSRLWEWIEFSRDN